jgi:PIN domain nuclease of toxin-antitoxin system
MRVLLDTHTLIWSAIDAPELSPKVRLLLADAKTAPICSIASFWEISIKVNLGKLDLSISLETFFDEVLGHVELLPIEQNHCIRYSALPFHHRDPFDRMLICQAQCENLAIVGNDEAFDAYGVQRIW